MYNSQLKNSFFFSFIPKIHIHRPVQAKKITVGQQPENSWISDRERTILSHPWILQLKLDITI